MWSSRGDSEGGGRPVLPAVSRAGAPSSHLPTGLVEITPMLSLSYMSMKQHLINPLKERKKEIKAQ